MAIQWPKGVILSEAEAKRLSKLYMRAELEILREVEKAMSRGRDLRYLRNLLNNVQRTTEELLTGTRTWVQQSIPRVYRQGLDEATLMIQKAGGAPRFGFGALHQQAVKTLADNSYQRLADVVNVIGRRTEDLYRQYALETTRQSVIGYKTTRQVADEFKRNLEQHGITGFVDRKGRHWNLHSYADMVARTTTMETLHEGTGNRLLEAGHDLVRISSHGTTCKLCAPWEGRVVSLTGKTKGYPTMEEARAAGLFHPNCKHTFYWQQDLED